MKEQILQWIKKRYNLVDAPLPTATQTHKLTIEVDTTQAMQSIREVRSGMNELNKEGNTLRDVIDAVAASAKRLQKTKHTNRRRTNK
jgi:hypothetical protein